MDISQLQIETSETGRPFLFITEVTTWEAFPTQARALVKALGGAVLLPISTADARLWLVMISWRPYTLAFEDQPWGMTLEPFFGFGTSRLSVLLSRIRAIYS